MPRLKDARKAPFFWIDNRVYQLVPRMGLGALKVYWCVAYHANGKGRMSYVSFTKMAAELGLDRRTVLKAVRELAGLGLLSVEACKTRRGLKAANLYTLLDPPEQASAGVQPAAADAPLTDSAEAVVGAWDVPTAVGALDVPTVGAFHAPTPLSRFEQDPVLIPPQPPQRGGVCAAAAPKEPEAEPSPGSTAPATAPAPPVAAPLPPAERAAFAQVRGAYPKPGPERKAVDAWVAAFPNGAPVAQVLAALEHYKRLPDWKREGGRFVPHLHKWLRDGYWKIEAPPAAPAPGSAEDGAAYRRRMDALQAQYCRQDGPGLTFAELAARAGGGQAR